jgi:periplasmic divalent cation tolerance protein
LKNLAHHFGTTCSWKNAVYLFIAVLDRKVQLNSEKNHMTDKIVVLSACASQAEAVEIARGLIEKRLAGCVNIVNQARSIYRWKDRIEESEEFLLLIKSNRAKLPELRSELERMHSYEVPEVVALAIVDGSEAYLSWLDRQLTEDGAPE